MINVLAEVMPASIFTALHSRAPGQSYTSGTECHTVLVGSRVQLQETVSAGTGSCGVSCLSSLCRTIILAVWWQQENGTVPTQVSLCRPVFLKLNRHILHWTQCTVNWSVTCFWYCRTAKDTLQRLRFWLFLTYLLSVIISRTTLTYNTKMSKLKRKCRQNYN